MVTIVFLQSLKNQRTTIVVLCLALIAFEALIAATFNSLYEDLPDIARDLLRAGGGSPTAYQAATGFRHPMFLVVVVGFVIAASSGAMAREIERGTAFILLARPIERYKVVLVRVATMVVVLLLMLLAAFVGVALGAQVFGLPDLDYGLLALAQVNTLFLLTAVAGYSLFVSSLSNDGGKATSISGGIAVVFFFVDFLAGTGGGGGDRQAHAVPLLRPRHRRLGGDARPAQHRGVGRRHRRRTGRRAGGVPAARHHAVGGAAGLSRARTPWRAGVSCRMSERGTLGNAAVGPPLLWSTSCNPGTVGGGVMAPIRRQSLAEARQLGSGPDGTVPQNTITLGKWRDDAGCQLTGSHIFSSDGERIHANILSVSKRLRLGTPPWSTGMVA